MKTSAIETSTVDLDALTALLDQVTPGPWVCSGPHPAGFGGGEGYGIDTTDDDAIATAILSPSKYVPRAEDARAIAALRNAAPELIAELRRLRADRADAVAALSALEREVRELTDALGNGSCVDGAPHEQHVLVVREARGVVEQLRAVEVAALEYIMLVEWIEAGKPYTEKRLKMVSDALRAALAREGK